ncbi:GNAT family N-acetyltransferase [Stagnihabitans tardus]|uniref:GNAT family N-acetyltransferase n=1 Tax=Stagnihabitans tardus TaxID=2699202 RepID=A0AAE4YBZ8_9RHOB|nr:GNAT family N-acetyltransferase [Stagnihabitans tardus]NBZ86895.1 GNAT family N-acetyltransferase [Stagnihabitans tardus]
MIPGMIRATEADRAEIEAFLMPHAHQAMFPLNNLAHHGMAGGSPYAVTLWLTRRAGQITDVLTLTDGGMVMPFLPSGDYGAAAGVLAGRKVSGIVGVRDWARGLGAALDLTRAAKTLDQDEPHFLLDVADLTIPQGPGQILPLSEAPEAVIKSWMLDYQLAALGTPADRAPKRVEESYATYTKNRSHVVLMDQGTPLAMTGFNARIPGIVQVGGVYTPPDRRKRGHAGRAVALHIAASGAARATLFAVSEPAARAYRRIGFGQVGSWSLILLHDPEVIHG